MTDNHPADELWARIVIAVTNSYVSRGEGNSFPKIKQWLHDFGDKMYEQGKEDECSADKGLGGTR